MMTTRYHKSLHSSKNHFWLIFAITAALVCTMSAYFIAGGYLNAFAEENPVPDQDAEAIENGDVNVTISSEGQGSLSPEGGTISVASGTVYKVYGNELTIGDKKYTANVFDGYSFSGWFLDDQYMSIYGTITQACAIKAKFTDESSSCTISGKVTKDGKGYGSANVRVVSESYPAIVVSAKTSSDGSFSLKIPQKSEVYVCSYMNNMTGYSDLLTADVTSSASYNLPKDIELKTKDDKNCLLTGKLSLHGQGGVKDAGIIYLWDEHSSGSYDFRTNTVYTNTSGDFYCMGKHAKDAYVLYFGPGICMSTRRVSATETQGPQKTVSYVVKQEGHPVYMDVPSSSKYSYNVNLATLDCADVLNLNFKSTINLGLEDSTEVEFNGDSYSYTQHDDVDPWRAANGIYLRYTITAKPDPGYSFKGWLVDGQPVGDGQKITINKQTVITANVAQNITINGLVKSKSGGDPLENVNVFFTSLDESKIYASSTTGSDGKFTWAIPSGITGKLIAYKPNYEIYVENSYTPDASAEKVIELEDADPYPERYYVKGTVKDKNGNILPGAIVSYFGDEGTRDYTISGFDGSFVVDLVENREDGVLVVSKDYYMTDFIACKWTDLGQWYINVGDVKLWSYTEAKTTYLGMSENQASYDLSLYYDDELIDTTTYTQPFTLYFKDFTLKEDGEVLYLHNLNGSKEIPSGFMYKVTSKAISSDYIFKGWDIKVPNGENAIFQSTDIMPIYTVPGDNPDPGTNTKTGDLTFLIIAGLFVVIVIAGGTALMLYRRKNSYNPKHI